MNVSAFLGTLGIWTVISSIILIFAWATTLIVKKQAALRHFIWVVAFATLIIVPMLSAFFPARFVIDVAPKPVIVERILSDQEVEAVDQANLDLSAEPIVLAKSFDWKPITSGVAGIWLLGFSLLLVKLILGVQQAKAMRRASRLQEISSVVPHRTTEVRVSLTRRPPSALTWGILRPVVILPQDSETWTVEKLEAVMRHEFAHVRRLDSLSQMLALSICAFYWFNPLVWLAARALRADAEIAADDAVVRSGISPSAYAAELLQIATEFGRQRQPLTTIGVSLMKQSQIETRILSIVDPTNRRRGVASIQGISVLAVGAFAAVALVSLRPTIAVAQDQQKSSIQPKIVSGQPASNLKPAISQTEKKVVGIQLAQTRPVTVQGKKLKKGNKQKSKIMGRPAVGVHTVNVRSVPAIVIQSKNDIGITDKPAIAYSTEPRSISIQTATDPITSPATTIQVKPTQEAVKATTIQSKGGIVHYNYNPKTKNYETLAQTRINQNIDAKSSTMIVTTQDSSRTYKTSLAKINYQPAKALTHRVATSGEPMVIDSVKTTASIAGQQSGSDQEKTKRLEEVQVELQKARAQSQAMEAERNAALTQLNKAQMELDLARTKQMKSKKSKRVGIKSNQAQIELKQALIQREIQLKQSQDAALKLNLRKAEQDRLVVDEARVTERNLVLKGLAGQKAVIAKKQPEAYRVVSLRNIQRKKEAFDAANKEREAKRRLDQAGQLEKRAKREQEVKAAEDKARAEKKKSGGS
jgi:beta-lactamase regulating signal transducer with metallopeptidase domain